MAKTAILMPYPELKQEAEAMIARYPRIQPMCVEYVETSMISQRAHDLEMQGCEMIIARGMQARIVRRSVVIPVSEMRASTQELESLVIALAKQTRKTPGSTVRIGIIGFFNMFHSMERFNEAIGVALGIELRIYTATDIEQYPLLVDRAYAEHCQGVIGGTVVGNRAAELGLNYAFLAMGEESMREVMETATRVAYSIDLMRNSRAEMSIMLDNTFSAIMQVDHEGTVLRANKACYQLLGMQSDEVVQRPITDVIEGLDKLSLAAVLQDGREMDLQVVVIQLRSVVINMIPVKVDEHIQGAILTFQEGRQISLMDAQLRQELVQQGYVARYAFKDMVTTSPDYHAVLRQAQRLAKHSQAVLLTGEAGVGKSIIAQCIHSASLRRDHAFVDFDCSVWHPDDIDEKLFGRFSTRKDAELSTVELSRGGTLYIRHPQLMSPETQYKLFQLASGRYIQNSRNEIQEMDVRLIVSTTADLKECLRSGRLREDLYFVLSALRLEVPPLRQRVSDIVPLFTRILEEWSRRYKRNMVLTSAAEAFLKQYSWPGNLDQMNSLCKRLVLLADSRTVSDSVLSRHLSEMTGQTQETESRADVYRDPRAGALMDVLMRNHGNRERTAAELGISKTTLWRRMKEYGIDRRLMYSDLNEAEN